MLSRILCVSALIASLLSSAALAGPGNWDETLGDPFIVVDHQPHRYGGPAADTDLITEHGAEGWQLSADDVLLDAQATINHVTWWGFYGASGSPWEPPLGDETFRLRVYSAHVDDGLPDDVGILYEETFLNPMREATGRSIAVGAGPDEYRFDVDLPLPMMLLADTQYWLEIVQVDDPVSHYHWEYSVGESPGRAFRNTWHDYWQATELGDLAFQLSTVPEPTTLAMLAIGVFLIQRSKKGNNRRAETTP